MSIWVTESLPKAVGEILVNGTIPKTILAAAEQKNAKEGRRVVFEIEDEPENADEGYKHDYWVYLGNGYYNPENPGCGIIHESTAKRCVELIKKATRAY